MSVIRAFIAISLSPETYQHLEEVSRQLQERLPGAPVRWAAANHIHLTIKFLGGVSLSNLEVLKNILGTEVAHHAPFEISVGKLGAFPSQRRPHVLWVGVEVPAELNALQRGIEAEMARLGYAREERPFSPHLTLGRVGRNAAPDEVRQISEVLGRSKIGFLGATRVQSVHLFQSDLQPGGSVYTRLFSAPLAAAN